jgi:hypothetical protein
MKLWRPPARTPCKYCPYRKDVPSGVWAAEHGMREIKNPSPEAVAAIEAIRRMRTDVEFG